MPQIETRPGQAYAGKRAVMAMRDFETRVPRLTAEVMQWLDQQGITPTGKPFLRFHVIDMPERLEVELGIPVSHIERSGAGIGHGVLPAGRYATSTYTGIANGLQANQRLIAWITGQGEEMHAHASAHGDVFESRYETTLTDVQVEPDQDRWQTEIAIKLRD